MYVKSRICIITLHLFLSSVDDVHYVHKSVLCAIPFHIMETIQVVLPSIPTPVSGHRSHERPGHGSKPFLPSTCPALKGSLPHCSMCKPEEGRITDDSQQASHLAKEAILESLHARIQAYRLPHTEDPSSLRRPEPPNYRTFGWPQN